MLTALIDTPSTYKGYIGDVWYLDYDLPPATMMPDQVVVDNIKASDSSKKQVNMWYCFAYNSNIVLLVIV